MKDDDILGLPKKDTGIKVTADYLKDSYKTPARPIWHTEDFSPGVAVEVPPVEKLKDMLEKARIFEDVAEDTGRVISSISFAPKIKRIAVAHRVTLTDFERMRLVSGNPELVKERIVEDMLKELVKALDESGLTNLTETHEPDCIMYQLFIDVQAYE